jgi:hypothetical protein
VKIYSVDRLAENDKKGKITMKMKSQDDSLSRAEGLISSVESRIHDEAAKNRETIRAERMQELSDSRLPEEAKEAESALPLIEKAITDATPFFTRAAKLDFRAVPQSFGYVDPIVEACRQFRMLSNAPHTLREGLEKFRELSDMYQDIPDDYDRRKKIARCRECFAPRHIGNLKAAIDRERARIEEALSAIDRQLRYEHERNPDMKIKTVTAGAPVAKPSEKGLVETEFTPS